MAEVYTSDIQGLIEAVATTEAEKLEEQSLTAEQTSVPKMEINVIKPNGVPQLHCITTCSRAVDLKDHIAGKEQLRRHQVHLLSIGGNCDIIADDCNLQELNCNGDTMSLQMALSSAIGPFCSQKVDIQHLVAVSGTGDGQGASLSFYEADVFGQVECITAPLNPERHFGTYVNAPHYEDFNSLQEYRVLNYAQIDWIRMQRYQSGKGYPYAGKEAESMPGHPDVLDLVLHVPETTNMATVCSFECPITATYCISGLGLRKVVENRIFDLRVFTWDASDDEAMPTRANTEELHVQLPGTQGNDGSWVRSNAAANVDLKQGDHILFALTGWFDCGSARVSWHIDVL